jgi:hypothetical protein
MLKLFFGIMLSLAQLSGSGGLPQVLIPHFKTAGPIRAGKKTDIIVSFTALKDYAIDRLIPITLKLAPTPNVTLAKTEIKAPSEDPKSKNGYYVDLPILRIPLTVVRAGDYEIPGQVTFFFCSEKDGFCSRQTVSVKIPVSAQ